MMKRNIRQLIRASVVATIVACCLDGAAAQKSAPRPASQEALRTLLDAFQAFNAGKKDKFRAAWADKNVYIVDDLPPYIWSGEGAWDKWMSDASAASGDLAHLSIRALKPLRVDVGEKLAYVLLPVEVTYDDHGKPMIQTGTQIDIMVRSREGWKIQAMSYAGQTPVPRCDSASPPAIREPSALPGTAGPTLQPRCPAPAISSIRRTGSDRRPSLPYSG